VVGNADQLRLLAAKFLCKVLRRKPNQRLNCHLQTVKVGPNQVLIQIRAGFSSDEFTD
jgi:hypothetical protein